MSGLAKAKSSVLIVEDDTEFSNALIERLRAENYLVSHSTKLADALWKLRNQRFDCILLDLSLKQGGEGEEIISHLRSNAKEPNHATPIIIVSGSLSRAALKRMGPLAKISALVKPILPEQLIERLQAIVSSGDIISASVGLSPESPSKVGSDRPTPDVVAACAEELSFLHELSTPLSAIFFLVDEISECFETLKATEGTGPRQMTTVMKSLEQVQELLKTRKDLLYKRKCGE